MSLRMSLRVSLRMLLRMLLRISLAHVAALHVHAAVAHVAAHIAIVILNRKQSVYKAHVQTPVQLSVTFLPSTLYHYFKT